MYAAKQLRSDKEVVLAALAGDVTTLRYAAPELWSDREFMLAACAVHGYALQYASEELQVRASQHPIPLI